MKKLIEKLEIAVAYLVANREDLNAHSWREKQGIVISGNDAREIIKFEKEIATLKTKIRAADNLKTALKVVMADYQQLSDCGDCGNLDIENSEEFVLAREAIENYEKISH